MQFEKVKYKDLEVLIESDLNTVEFIVNDKILNTLETYINFITTVIKFASYCKPDYVIINKLDSEFKLNPGMFDYTRSIVFNQLKSFGTLGMVMLVKEDHYQNIYKEINKTEPFLYGFYQRDVLYNWIRRNKNNHGDKVSKKILLNYKNSFLNNN